MPGRMTDDDIKRGLELARAATPRPWYQQVDCSQLDENGNGPVGRCVSIYEDDICDAIAWMSDREDSPQNHAYIIEACDHYPAALQELAELRAEVADLKNYVGDEMYRSDYQTAAAMRADVEKLRSEVSRWRATASQAQQEVFMIRSRGE